MKEKQNNTNQHILLVTSSNFPFGSASANVLRLFAVGLANEGNEVSVLIQRGKQFGNTINQEAKINKVEKVAYRYCGFVQRPNNFFLKILDSFLGTLIPILSITIKKLKSQVDIVTIYNHSGFEIALIVFFCRILRVPVVNHVVEWYDKASVVTNWWRIVNWWDFMFCMKIVNKFGNGLIVTSNFLKNYYLEHPFKDESIFILPNLVDMSVFETTSKLVNKYDQIQIGYCGTPTRKDGIDDLLEAFQIVYNKNKKTKLMIIGDHPGPLSLLPVLKEKCRMLGIAEGVEFTGLVEWKKMPELLNSCDILVLARPSGRFAEAGFPTKLGEYMACRKPVVVTSVGDLPLYLQDGVTAMIAEPDNPQSIADKINELIEKPALANEIAENGYKWADDKLNYLKVTKEICTFLDNYQK